MRSRLLVAAQFALIAVLLVPRGMAWSPLGVAAIAAGVAIGLWALAANRPGNFNIRPDPKPGGQLVVAGPYRYVRHPMYVAVMSATLGLVLLGPAAWRIAAWIALGAVLHAKAGLEEEAMLRTHAGYAAYRARTARWIPFLW